MSAAIEVSKYHFNPYATEYPFEACEVDRLPAAARLPRGTLHHTIAARVAFVPYPDRLFPSKTPAVSKANLERVFIGQLPLHVTDMQIEWMCRTFAHGCTVHYPERIMKRASPGEERAPTGCVHAYCRPEEVPILIEGLHKRLLFDDTGVWYARKEEEFEELKRYVVSMHRGGAPRFGNRPFNSVVVQLATSTFDPNNRPDAAGPVAAQPNVAV